MHPAEFISTHSHREWWVALGRGDVCVCVCLWGSVGGALLHVHAKTFQGKPCQIFITVCGKGFMSPVTHTRFGKVLKVNIHILGENFSHTPQLWSSTWQPMCVCVSCFSVMRRDMCCWTKRAKSGKVCEGVPSDSSSVGVWWMNMQGKHDHSV